MTLAETFAAARQRIADGREPPRLFMAQDWTPGPNYGRARPQTFAERRAAYASVIASVRRAAASDAYRRLRSQIIDETPACRALIAHLRDLENLPFGERMESRAEPIRAELEAIIAGRMAEEHIARVAA